MTNDELFPAYAALWNRAPRDDLWVHYVGLSDRGEVGYFQHDGQGFFKRPEIGILRPFHISEDQPSMERSDGVAVDLTAEMFTLVHEYGHYLSFSGATPPAVWRAYHRAAKWRDELLDAIRAGGCHNVLTHRDRLRRGLPGRAKQLITAEETLAWELGRQFVPEPLLAVYDERARHGVHCHRYRMGVDPLWPEDERRGGGPE